MTARWARRVAFLLLLATLTNWLAHQNTWTLIAIGYLTIGSLLVAVLVGAVIHNIDHDPIDELPPLRLVHDDTRPIHEHITHQ